MYKIKPLEWQESTRDDWFAAHASVPFGRYSVTNYEGKVTWEYCFDDCFDEETFEVASVEEAKAAAEAHWIERLSGALEPVAGISFSRVNELLTEVSKKAWLAAGGDGAGWKVWNKNRNTQNLNNG